MSNNRVSMYERTRQNDIPYRGPFSYRHLRIIGWITASILLFAIILGFGMDLAPEKMPDWIFTLQKYTLLVGSIAVPLFLIANYSVILDRKLSYAHLIGQYAILTAVVVVLFELFVEHYAIGLYGAFIGNRDAAQLRIEEVLNNAVRTGDLNINIFIDLLLCTLFMYFLNYTPKMHFLGKNLKWFRLCAVLPVACEVTSLVVRILMGLDMIRPPLIVCSLLTTKAPLSFALFLLMVFYMKIKERMFLKHGKTKDEFRLYTRTKANSLDFSVFLSASILVTGILDYVLRQILTRAIVPDGLTGEQLIIAVEEKLRIVTGWGFGKHMALIGVIPFILLFSYNRNHRNLLADTLIPVGGVILAVLVGLETVYRALMVAMPTITAAVSEIMTEAEAMMP